MLKVKIIAAILALVAVFVLPTLVAAQPEVSRFHGSVTLDGSSVANGTAVKAWIGGQLAGETNTTDSDYVLVIDGTGNNFSQKSIQFTVGPNDAPAAESSTFVKGGNVVLDLNAVTGAEPPGEPTLQLKPVQGMGATNVCGENFLQNSPVTITVDGDVCSLATANADGGFCVSVAVPGAEPGEYTIAASDSLERSASAAFTLVAPQGGSAGEAGPQGEQGEQGEPGPAGPGGKNASSTLGIVALVIAALGLVVSLTIFQNWRRRYH